MSTPDPSRQPSVVAEITLASMLDDAPNYRKWIVDLCAPHLVGPVLEVGAGRETSPTASGSPALFTAVAGAVGDLPGAPRFGSAVMINVLERIDDDQAALRGVLDRLEPGGRLCIWAPTYEFLRGRFDGELGHVRRYRKRQLEADVRLAGYEVVEGRHVNLPGWLGWLVFCRILRGRPTSPVLVRFLDTLIVPVVRWFESRVKVPIGMSVFLVARKPDV